MDFTKKGRRENVRRVGEVSKLFAESGMIILVALVSPYRDDRNLVRKILKPGQFIEIYVDCPIGVCEDRDVKGMYKKARKGREKKDKEEEAHDRDEMREKMIYFKRRTKKERKLRI